MPKVPKKYMYSTNDDPSKPLPINRAKWENLCIEYLKDGNPKEAGHRAGYKGKVSHLATKILESNFVAPRLKWLQQQKAAKLEISAEYILSRIKDIAEDPTSRKDHKLKALELLGKNLSLFTTKIKHEGIPQTPTTLSISVIDKTTQQNLDLLTKNDGMPIQPESTTDQSQPIQDPQSQESKGNIPI